MQPWIHSSPRVCHLSVSHHTFSAEKHTQLFCKPRVCVEDSFKSAQRPLTGEGCNTSLWKHRYNTCISIMLAFSANWLTDHPTDRGGILQAFNNLAIAAQPPVFSLKPTAHLAVVLSLLFPLSLHMKMGSAPTASYHHQWLLWSLSVLLTLVHYTVSLLKAILSLHTCLQGSFL